MTKPCNGSKDECDRAMQTIADLRAACEQKQEIIDGAREVIDVLQATNRTLTAQVEELTLKLDAAMGKWREDGK